MQGKWTASANWNWIVDPLNGEKFIKIAEVQGTEIKVWLGMLLLYARVTIMKHNSFRFKLFHFS